MSDEFVPYAEGALPWVPPDVQAAFPRSGPIHQYMHWATQCTDAPPLFHIGALLPTFATRIAWTGVELHDRLPSRLWCLLVAGAGFGKSTPLKLAQNFIRDHLEMACDTPHEHPMIRFEGTTQGLFAALQDSMVEGLEREIALIHTDEAAPILTQRYQDSAGKFFCQLYDGERMERQVLHLQKAAAKGEGKRPVLQRPTISAAFACTVDEFEMNASKNVVGNGLLSRFLAFHAMPDRFMFEQLEHPEARAAALSTWAEWFGALRGELLTRSGRLVLTCSAQAKDLLRERVFEPFVSRVKADPGDPLFAVARRGQTHVSIVAGLYALNRLSWEVGEQDMQQAVELFEHTMTFSRHQVPRLGQGETFRYLDRVEAVVAASAGAGTAKSEFYAAIRGITRKALDEAIDHLEDAGSIVRITATEGRGRREQRFYTKLYAAKMTEQPN